MFQYFFYCLPMAITFALLCFWVFLLIRKQLCWRKGVVLSVFLSLALGGSWFSLSNGYTTWCGTKCGVVLKRKEAKRPDALPNGKILVESNGRQYPSVVAVKLANHKLEGEGLDSLGQFAIEGKLISSRKIQFVKKYSSEAKRKGAVEKPIAFYGELSEMDGKIHAKGVYKFSKRVGYEKSIRNPCRWVPVSGKWKGVFDWNEINRS